MEDDNKQPEVAYEVPATTPEEITTPDGVRPCKVIELPISKFKVSVADYYSRGETDDMKKSLAEAAIYERKPDGKLDVRFDPVKSMVAEKLQIKNAVKKIVDAKDAVVVYDEKWRQNLPEPDAVFLEEYIKHVLGKGKKKQ